MKAEQILKKLISHRDKKRYVKIFRKVAKGTILNTMGFVLDYSDKLVLVQETDDFELNGYSILPFDLIKELRYIKWDRYYQKIMEMENMIPNVGIDYPVDLTSWESAFQSIQKQNLNVIVHCDDPADTSFDIGPIIKTGGKKVHIRNFDAEGYFDEEHSVIDYKLISSVQFGDRYSTIFGKYTRERPIAVDEV